MTKKDAEVFIAKLDNLEARCRDIETEMTRLRRELQDEFRIKMWDYDPAKPAITRERLRRGAVRESR